MNDATPAAALTRLGRLAALAPVGFEGDRLHLLLVEDAEPIPHAGMYLRALDAPSLMPERAEYLVEPPRDWPFPTIIALGRPDPITLSDVLFRRWEFARSILPRQSQTGEYLLAVARAHEAEIVLLMIVDGMSYFDLQDMPGLGPVLVDGVSITTHGFPAVIGRPPVSQHMFAAGYRQQLGFSYFDPAVNPLAAQVFDLFSPPQMYRVREIGDVVRVIRATTLRRAFIQVTAMGLDDIAHEHRDRPLVADTTRAVLDRFYAVVEELRKGGRRVVACLTADHGILWLDMMRPCPSVTRDLFDDGARHPRYTRGALVRAHARVVRHEGQAFSVLAAPYLTREPRINEWGFHGGISAWESLVPFLVVKE